MNKTIITGNLGNDCQVNTVGEKQVINFSVAVTRKYKDKSGASMENTTWFACNYWPTSTGISPYLKKGAKVLVEGEISLRTYGDAGNLKASLDLRVNSVELIGGQQQAESAPAKTQQAVTETEQRTQEMREVADDLPF